MLLIISGIVYLLLFVITVLVLFDLNPQCSFKRKMFLVGMSIIWPFSLIAVIFGFKSIRNK